MSTRPDNYGHELAFSSGGYPLTTQSFLYIQQAWKDIEERFSSLLFDEDDTYIVSGCQLNTQTGLRSDGLVVFHGRLYIFLASAGDVLCAGRFTIPDDTKPIVTYADDSRHPVAHRYYAAAFYRSGSYTEIQDPYDGEPRALYPFGVMVPFSSVPRLDVRLRSILSNAASQGGASSAQTDLTPVYNALADLEDMLNDGLRSAGDDLSEMARDNANTYATKADLNSAKNNLNSSISSLRSALASEQTSRETADERITADYQAADSALRSSIAAMQNSLMPRGALIIYSQELPLWATSLAEITSGRSGAWPALPYGYLPCADFSWVNTSTDTLNAWTAYIRALGFNIQTLNNLNFPALSSAIGLNIPDLGGRFPLGVNSHFTQRLATGGAETHTLTVDEMPSHTHEDSHPVRAYAANIQAEPIRYAGGSNDALRWKDENFLNKIYLTNTGGSQPFSIMPPFVALHYLIKII